MDIMKMSSQKLLDKMIKIPIDYGLYDYKHDKIIKPDMKEFDEPGYLDKNCRILKPYEVLEYKIGTCWDCCLLELYILKKYYNEVYCVYIEQGKDIETNFITHTFIVYKDNDKYYWFEYAWYKQEGIHGPFNSLKDVIQYEKEIQENDKQFKTFYINENCNKILSLLNKPIITINMFMNICNPNREELKMENNNKIEKKQNIIISGNSYIINGRKYKSFAPTAERMMKEQKEWLSKHAHEITVYDMEGNILTPGEILK
jgi:hypothetical protein